MDTQEQWLKFIISGKVSDYINYANSKRYDGLTGGEPDALYDGRTCNKRDEHRRTRPADNVDDA